MQNPDRVRYLAFPMGIQMSKYQEDFKKELNFISSLEYLSQPIEGLFRSKNSYLMKQPELSKLKTFFQLELAKYCDEILGSKSKLDITQAWVHRITKNSYLHEHVHSNSIVSGVFYFRNDNHANITFSKDTTDRITLQRHTVTEFNAEDLILAPQSGDLILFPSQLKHGVSINTKEKDRYSLAFNTFCFGELGNELSATQLIINEENNA